MTSHFLKLRLFLIILLDITFNNYAVQTLQMRTVTLELEIQIESEERLHIIKLFY